MYRSSFDHTQTGNRGELLPNRIQLRRLHLSNLGLEWSSGNSFGHCSVQCDSVATVSLLLDGNDLDTDSNLEENDGPNAGGKGKL